MAKSVQGLAQIRKALKKYDKDMHGALRVSLYQEALAIDALSVALVPVDKGFLKNSHFVSPPTKGRKPHVEVGYGTHYAVYQHEGIDFRHTAGQSAKFLEIPTDIRRRGWAKRLARRTLGNFAASKTTVFPTAPTRPAGASKLGKSKDSGRPTKGRT